MLFNEMFPSPWLKADDIGDGLNLTIKQISTEQVGKEKEVKPVIHWQEDYKSMILNKTNGKSIASMYGDDSADWIGKTIDLYQTAVEVASETYQVVRVKPPQEIPF